MSALDHSPTEDSLEVFLLKVRPLIKTLFQRYHIPAEDSEDILQQALLALLHHREAIRDPEKWLHGTLKNKCLVYWRDQRRKLYEAVDVAVLEVMVDPLAPDQERTALRRDLESMIERLPRRCRSILSLRYRQGYEPAELAELLGYREASITKVTNRCVAALTRRIAAGGVGRGPHAL